MRDQTYTESAWNNKADPSSKLIVGPDTVTRITAILELIANTLIKMDDTQKHIAVGQARIGMSLDQLAANNSAQTAADHNEAVVAELRKKIEELNGLLGIKNSEINMKDTAIRNLKADIQVLASTIDTKARGEP